MAVFPEMPPELRTFFPNAFWNFWQAFKTYLQVGFWTKGNVEVLTPGNGVVMASPNGQRWLVRISDAGAVTITAL